MKNQVPLWEVIRVSDVDADHGENSAMFLKVSLWLEANHPQLMVEDSAPVNWADVHAVLAGLPNQHDDMLDVLLKAVVNRLAEYLLFRQTA